MDRESLIPLAAIATTLAPELLGRELNRCTPWRWATRGRLVRGERVILRTVTIAGRRLTDRESVRDFLAAK